MKSEAGRWEEIGHWDEGGTPADPNDDVWIVEARRWVYDDVTSPCIDAGSPGFGLGDELAEESNVRINMGAYGGRVEASRTPAGWGLLADMNNDGIVGLGDFAILGELFGLAAERQAGDMDRDGLVGLADLAVLVEEWMWP